ncbi:MAG: hypothetical protein DWQ10_09430, partial [Calditrichaeota bacterium]
QENVHFLVYNNEDYIPGAGDSGEKWLHMKPDLRIEQVIARLSNNAVCFASHPEAAPPFFQNLLLNRGKWHDRDYEQTGLHGLQIWNGEEETAAAGLKKWRHLLLQGKRLFIIAGTDAHGNFNRFRQITRPLMAMADRMNWQVFGSHRTLVFHPGKATTHSLAKALHSGAMVVTSGPFFALHAIDEKGNTVQMGGQITTANCRLVVRGISSNEFGDIKEVSLYRGDLLKKTEDIILQETTFKNPHDIAINLALKVEPDQIFYYRAALRGEMSHSFRMQALTNPVWHGSGIFSERA